MALHIENSFVVVAEDCPAKQGVAPTRKNGRLTKAVIEYELLSRRPYQYTLADLIFETHVAKEQISAADRTAEESKIRLALFARSHACMRASPLTKNYGWGAHYDEKGRLAIYARESPDYARLAQRPDLEVVKAMRNRRA